MRADTCIRTGRARRSQPPSVSVLVGIVPKEEDESPLLRDVAFRSFACFGGEWKRAGTTRSRTGHRTGEFHHMMGGRNRPTSPPYLGAAFCPRRPGRAEPTRAPWPPSPSSPRPAAPSSCRRFSALQASSVSCRAMLLPAPRGRGATSPSPPPASPRRARPATNPAQVALLHLLFYGCLGSPGVCGLGELVGSFWESCC